MEENKKKMEDEKKMQQIYTNHIQSQNPSNMYNNFRNAKPQIS